MCATGTDRSAEMWMSLSPPHPLQGIAYPEGRFLFEDAWENRAVVLFFAPAPLLAGQASRAEVAPHGIAMRCCRTKQTEPAFACRLTLDAQSSPSWP